MASIIVHYDRRRTDLVQVNGQLRSLDWDRQDVQLTVVGGHGFVGRFHDGSLARVESGVTQNLRAISINPKDGTMLIVGNRGTVLLLEDLDRVAQIYSPTSENLRAVAWNTSGDVALVAGNNGVLMRYENHRLDFIGGAMANLRDVSWRPNHDEALVTSNCFAEEFIPSPNLFTYDANANLLKRLNESRADLIAVDWNSKGDGAMVVGYDVVWHTGVIASYKDQELTNVDFHNKRVYPTSVHWNPAGNVAAIGTATSEPGVGTGKLLLWDGNVVKEVYNNPRFFFSELKWSPDGSRFGAVASSGTRAFNA
ncbi:MAG TPA: WD40 repeat domain-containing protein [Terriglobales bacterium]|nr:WD40 repeat domain-containing protein [Terriglobales bacterium]